MGKSKCFPTSQEAKSRSMYPDVKLAEARERRIGYSKDAIARRSKIGNLLSQSKEMVTKLDKL